MLSVAARASAHFAIEPRDTESLCAEADLIVVGKVVDDRQFRVDEVLNGPIERPPRRGWAHLRPAPAQAVRADDTIRVSSVKIYTVSSDLLVMRPSRNVAAGDRLTLFLKRSADGWLVPPNGLRLLVQGRAYAFEQRRIPGGRAKQLATTSMIHNVRATPLTETAFRERIRRSLATEPARRQALASATPSNLSPPLELCALADRVAPGELIGPEYWREEAVATIEAIAEARTLVGLLHRPDAAGFRFGPRINWDTECRELMLRSLETTTGAADRRRRAIRAFFGAGYEYAIAMDEAIEQRLPLPHEGRFARRLAALAVREADEENRRNLLSILAGCAGSGSIPSTHPLTGEDLDAATRIVARMERRAK